MAALTWDGNGEKFYETGVSRGVLYVQNSNGSYATGVAWNGLTGVTESPDGAEPTDLYADNIKYASFRSAETFGGTIEAYTYPEEFAECDGSYVPSDGVYVGQQGRKPFAFCYRTEVGSDTNVANTSGGDYKLHIVYGATASPSEKSYETINDSPDAITFSWEFTTTPVTYGDGSLAKPTSLIVIDTSKLSTESKSTYLPVLESKLYGAQNSDPTCLLPHQVVSVITTGQLPT